MKEHITSNAIPSHALNVEALAGVSGAILEGIEEILTVTRLGLPGQLRQSLACTNMIENAMATVRRVCRNVKHWHSPSMAMRWTAAANVVG
jgi:putative transposase